LNVLDVASRYHGGTATTVLRAIGVLALNRYVPDRIARPESLPVALYHGSPEKPLITASDPHERPSNWRGATRQRRLFGMNFDALWHYLECGAYREDLPLWRALVAEVGGPVLDVGAGTGRVTVDLAARGVAVVALDIEAALLAALERRATGLPVETVVADARQLAMGRRFSLVIVPMQTLQLLGGARGRAAFLRRALTHLEPGGLLAAALADAMDCFDEERDTPPPADACEIAGVRYASQLLTAVDQGARAAIHRRREIIAPGKRCEAHNVVVELDRVSASDVAAEAGQLGFLNQPHLYVPPTEHYLGSTVVVLQAPRE